MNKAQKAVLILGSFAMTLTLVFVRWNWYDSRSGNASSEIAALFNSAIGPGRIDIASLVAEWVVIIFVTIALLLVSMDEPVKKLDQ